MKPGPMPGPIFALAGLRTVVKIGLRIMLRWTLGPIIQASATTTDNYETVGGKPCRLLLLPDN
jgi:hypothetical protein